jgi:hypothetical protein
VIVDQVIATLHHLFCDLPRHTFCLRLRGISGIEAIHALSVHRVHVRNFLLKRRNIDQWKNDHRPGKFPEGAPPRPRQIRVEEILQSFYISARPFAVSCQRFLASGATLAFDGSRGNS